MFARVSACSRTFRRVRVVIRPLCDPTEPLRASRRGPGAARCKIGEKLIFAKICRGAKAPSGRPCAQTVDQFFKGPLVTLFVMLSSLTNPSRPLHSLALFSSISSPSSSPDFFSLTLGCVPLGVGCPRSSPNNPIGNPSPFLCSDC